MKFYAFALSLLIAVPLSAQDLSTPEHAQTRVGIGFAGGNPVPGASSTLGMRIGRVPRISLAVRGAMVDVDPSRATSWNVDAAVGVFSGVMLAPTIGGFGSIDIIGSVGKLGLSDDAGYTTDPSSWAIGARVGILRESFTVPGVSVSGVIRKFGVVNHGSAPDIDRFTLADNSMTSLRATVGKRLFVFGATAGIGYDKFSSELDVGQPKFKNSRHTAFIDATWTMLILNLVAEAGVQRGGDDNGYFGSLAARLVL